MEGLGEQGKVEESKNMLKLVDGLRANIKELETKRLVYLVGVDIREGCACTAMCLDSFEAWCCCRVSRVWTLVLSPRQWR